MIYRCRDERRREAVRALSTLGFNGIDFVEVVDTSTLHIHFINPLRARDLKKEHVQIEGGVARASGGARGGGGSRAIADARATARVAPTIDEPALAIADMALLDEHVLRVAVKQPGSSARYTLRVDAAFMDPQLSEVNFTFLPANDFDCKPEGDMLLAIPPAPDIDYLAKDYTSFRQLMLDRLSVLIPEWQERSPSDVGIMLVEMLAYVGDRLSYRQDVIATEAYLGTARRRISVRRHARLLDYTMSEGSNARVWVQVQVNKDVVGQDDGGGQGDTHSNSQSVSKKAALPQGTKLLTRVSGYSHILCLETPKERAQKGKKPSAISYVDDSWVQEQALNGRAEVFETMHAVDGLFLVHNTISFYTWGASECYLPQGATSATLRGAFRHLKEGDVLIFKEILNPQTGRAEDADMTRRHVVRLTKVDATKKDPLGKWFLSPHLPEDAVEKGHDSEDVGTESSPNSLALEEQDTIELKLEQSEEEGGRRKRRKREPKPDYSVDITEIEWQVEDALPFPLCISTRIQTEDGSFSSQDVSVALGNIVLADHGCTVQENWEPVPEGHIGAAPRNMVGATLAVALDSPTQQHQHVSQRFSLPPLSYTPLTYALPYNANDLTQSAAALGLVNVHTITPTNAVPAISLKSDRKGYTRTTWHAKADLLASGPSDPHFVVEIDDIGRACLRFGDDFYGLLPAAGTTFSATYRIGNGIRGNVGQESLYHIAIDKADSLLAQMDYPVILVNNPMNAHGGVNAQSIDDVRQHVFSSFSLQERGVTPGDYKEIAEREPDIQKANAIINWTGSWYTVLLTAEPVSGVDFNENFHCELARRMEYFRMIGTDLVIVPPIYVPLEISMTVTVQPSYARKIVRDTLREIFSNRQWPDGQRGIFHSANYTFGQPVYLSELYAAAYGVVGVQRVKVDTFSRQDRPYVSGLDEGQLTMDWMEIARLENDPDVPDKGIFRLNVVGGL